mmetsp:Transcript_10105/g.41177  ORF Transcript_10105/g.41177 Transcript_10105/m.41177 type:complete len:208 (+) Transcript_10105:1909-2532(+)
MCGLPGPGHLVLDALAAGRVCVVRGSARKAEVELSRLPQWPWSLALIAAVLLALEHGRHHFVPRACQLHVLVVQCAPSLPPFMGGVLAAPTACFGALAALPLVVLLGSAELAEPCLQLGSGNLRALGIDSDQDHSSSSGVRASGECASRLDSRGGAGNGVVEGGGGAGGEGEQISARGRAVALSWRAVRGERNKRPLVLLSGSVYSL